MNYNAPIALNDAWIVTTGSFLFSLVVLLLGFKETKPESTERIQDNLRSK